MSFLQLWKSYVEYVDCAESCTVAVTYFGTVQQMYNIFSSSPQRWEILQKYLPVSLQSISTTRWSARIDAVKPVANHLQSLRKALDDMETLNLTAKTRSELHAIKKYMSKFEFIVMSSIWIKLLTMINQTNLVIEARDATLDVERENVQTLIQDIKHMREQWDTILKESRTVAENIEFSTEFSTSRSIASQTEAEEYYKVSVYFVIIDSILSGLCRRFASLEKLCALFGFLWNFGSMNDDDMKSAADKF